MFAYLIISLYLVAPTYSTTPTVRCLVGTRSTYQVVHGFHSCYAVYDLFGDNDVVFTGQIHQAGNTHRNGCVLIEDLLNSEQDSANCTCYTDECNSPMNSDELVHSLYSTMSSSTTPSANTLIFKYDRSKIFGGPQHA